MSKMKDILCTAYIYKWTNLTNLMWYIGSRTAKKSNPEDGYICSSKIVKPLIVANPHLWKREILFQKDCYSVEEQKSMVELEYEILTLFDAKNDPRSYNRSNGGKFSTAGFSPSDMQRAKMGLAQKAAHANPEFKSRRKAALKQKWENPEFKAKMIATLTASHCAPGFREKIAKTNTGKKRTAEQKAAMSAAAKGRVFTEEHKTRISAAKKGVAISEIGRAKICKPCSIDGITIYESRNALVEVLGQGKNGTKHPNFHYVGAIK